jgi:hypothetical protein
LTLSGLRKEDGCTEIVLLEKFAPTFASTFENEFLTSLFTMQVLPTPASPTMIILNEKEFPLSLLEFVSTILNLKTIYFVLIKNPIKQG